MVPHAAARLTIHEPDVLEPRARARRLPALRAVPFPGGATRTLDAHPSRSDALLRREAVQRRLLALGDLLGATLALWFVLRVPNGPDHPLPLLIAGMTLVVLVFKLAGLYDRDQLRIVHSTLDEPPQLLQLTGLYVLGVVIAQSVLISGTLGGDQLAALWMTTFLLVVAGRMVARWVGGRAPPTQRCLVTGDRPRSDRLRAKLSSSRARATVVATLPLEGWDVLDPLDPEAVRNLVDELSVHRIIIVPTTAESADIVELIRIAKSAGVQVSVLPRMLEVVGSAVEFDNADGLTMLGVRPFGLSRSSRAVKRGFDIVATFIGLVAVAPIIAVIAAAIRLDSKGPIFFRQVRVGRDGRPFRIFKFRSMVVDAEAQKDRLRALNEVGESGAGMFKVTDDPRITRVGRVLRKTSLDEMPQLLNV